MKMLKRILSIAICVMMLTSVAFASNTSVIEYTSATEDGVTTVTATALATSVGEKAVSLYTAVYNADGSFAGAKKSNTTDSNLLKNTVTISDGQTVKSFIWEGSENTPVKMPATSGKVFTAEDVEITFDGVSFAEYVGSALAFDATDNIAEYTVDIEAEDADESGNINIPAPVVKVKDSTIHYTVENDEEAYTTTITLMSGRIVDDKVVLFQGKVLETDEKEVTYYKEAYEPAQKETIVISYNRNYFADDMFEDKDIGFIQNKTNYIKSYTFNYAEDVVNAPAIEGKTAVLSEVKVDGVAIADFAPDVFEYTVTVPAAQVNMPVVTFTAAGNATATKTDVAKLPAKTVITVTEGEVTNTYTINYALSSEILATDFTSADDGCNTATYFSKIYVPGGMTVGTPAYTSGTSIKSSYCIKEIMDDRLEGADLIRGDMYLYNGSNSDVYEGTAIPDFYTFKAHRGVEVVILTVYNAGKTNFTNNGYEYSNKSAGFLNVYSTRDNIYVNAYSRHFAANETVKIPNVAEDASRATVVALIWDDFTQSGSTIQDITLNAAKLSKNALVVLVPKDYSKDVIVQKNDDGTYSDVQWASRKTQVITSYDYEYDEDGNPIFVWDEDRAVGELYNTSVAKFTSGGTAQTNHAIKQLVKTDNQYVIGARPSTNRAPLSVGTSHFIDNMPEECYNANYIVVDFASGGYTDCKYEFSVNDNLKKIVVFNIADVANPTIGETVSTETTYKGDACPLYMMQSMQSGQEAMANNAISNFIAKGLMTEDDVVPGKFHIRRYSVLTAIDTQGKDPIESMMFPELYARATDASRDGDKWFFGELLLESTDLVEDLDLTDNIKAMLTNGKYGNSAVSAPEIRKFSSHAIALDEIAFTDSNSNLAGVTVSYPEWLEGEDITYIAPSYYWCNVPSGSKFGPDVFNVIDTATDMYSFKVTEDCTVMMALRGTSDNFWGLSEGWTKTNLTGDDIIVINRQSRFPDNQFKYNQLFTKDFEAGSVVTIKTPQADKIVPLVFVKSANK